MKKSLLAYLLGGGIIIVGVIYAFTSGRGKMPTLLENLSMGSVVPGTYDQLLVLQMDQALKNVAEKSNTLIDAETFGGIVETIEEIVMYQKIEGEVGHNILFIKGNNSFTIEQIEALGTLAGDESYEYADLGKGYWAYAPKETLTRYKNNTSSRISSNRGRKDLAAGLKKSGNNVGFLSVPVLSDTTNLVAGQFADRLEYTYFVSGIREKNPSGYLVLQLADETLTGPVSGIIPKLSTLLGIDPIMYVEFADILSLLAIEESQLEVMFPALLGQRGASQGIAFDNSDVGNLLEAFSKNIAIVAYPSVNSPMQLSLHVLFEDADAYATVSKFGPLLQGLVGGLLGNTDVDLIKEDVSENTLSYSLELPPIEVGSGGIDLPVPSGSFPLLEISTQPAGTVLSIFSKTPDIENDDMLGTDIAFTENSKAIFGRDAGLMQETFMQGALQQQSELLGVDTLFQTGSLAGYIDVLPKQQQVRLQFSVQ